MKLLLGLLDAFSYLIAQGDYVNVKAEFWLKLLEFD